MDNIYAAPNSDVSPREGEIHYSGFWIRLLASLIDTVWLLILTFALGWMIYGAIYFQSTEFTQGYADLFITYVLPFILTILFWYYKAATPGKMILGMRIVDANTLGKVSTGRLFLRYLSYYISMLALGLGFLWVGWDKRKQGWHDKIARTLVIKEK
ncbi:MAG: RDD family protein [Gammaproteobacteria bacterium]|nr:MAG: RDD family protein [Gammaproteobacteria bacterium]UCH40136.1 MAG: RDD family protein [Gammaproteobacteria bacterium]